ncbi:globin-like protein [Myriangium duriaei CBS 260.36]|uniref:nitric oxide dioxygenase n=1 Tax=Myriangium duriaei CBS 260.36 TaxID=1168546 RepID=A0A9P4MGG6_9PEZI|nr:globin-like protein [Myriangium duriaei CBS 260.36]
MALTPDQITIVKSTVPVLQQHGNEITYHFYHNMLEENPQLRDIFNMSNQQNSHQSKALAGAVLAYATFIDDLGVLSPAVEKICQKHASLYIRPEQYEIVGRHLIGAFGQVLGAALTPKILDAWLAAYWQLAKLMIGREQALMDDTHGWTDWRDFTIAEKVKESDEITSFYLKPVNSFTLPSFHPGQYISIMLKSHALPYAQTRQYSLSDAPRSDYYRISVKKDKGLNIAHPDAVARPGIISNILHDEKEVGDVIRVSHPAGEFFLNPSTDGKDESPIVLISAGVGITPMISILNSVVESGSKRPVSFIHGTKSTSIQAFAKHVKEAASKHPIVKTVFFVRTPKEETDIKDVDYHHTSRVQLDVLEKSEDLHLDNSKTKYFLCGPDSFASDILAGLVDLGVDNERISMDKFSVGMVAS